MGCSMKVHGWNPNVKETETSSLGMSHRYNLIEFVQKKKSWRTIRRENLGKEVMGKRIFGNVFFNFSIWAHLKLIPHIYNFLHGPNSFSQNFTPKSSKIKTNQILRQNSVILVYWAKHLLQIRKCGWNLKNFTLCEKLHTLKLQTVFKTADI